MNIQETLPTFIGGFRSGSTLLINLLGLHPEIAPWFETKFICEALRWQRVNRHPDQAELERTLMQPATPDGFQIDAVAERMRIDMQATAARIQGHLRSGKAAHERYPVGHDCVRYPVASAHAALGQWYDTVAVDHAAVTTATGELINTLGRQHAQSWDRRLWVNKTPEMPRFGTELRRCLGDCRIILLIRNGRDVALSSRRLRAGNVEKIAQWWKGLIEQSRSANPDPARYLEVRYEDLVSEPVRVLNEIFSFLDVSLAGDTITNQYRSWLGKNAFNRPWWLRWQRLRGRNRREFDRVAGDMLRDLGYRS